MTGPLHRDWNGTCHFKPVLHTLSRSQCEERMTWWIRIEDSKGERGRNGGEARRERGQGPVKTFYAGRGPRVITPFLVGKRSSYFLYRLLILTRHKNATDQKSYSSINQRDGWSQEGSKLWTAIKQEKGAEKISRVIGHVSLASVPSCAFATHPSAFPNLGSASPERTRPVSSWVDMSTLHFYFFAPANLQKERHTPNSI